jgi:hypothetical protein
VRATIYERPEWGAPALTSEEKMSTEDPLELERLADAHAERASSRFILLGGGLHRADLPSQASLMKSVAPPLAKFATSAPAACPSGLAIPAWRASASSKQSSAR